MGYKQVNIFGVTHSLVGGTVDHRYRVHCEVDGLDLYSPPMSPAQHTATWAAINVLDTEASWVSAHPSAVEAWLSARPAVERGELYRQAQLYAAVTA